MSKKVHVGTIKRSDLKVRKKKAPPTQIQKSPRDYDRKQLKRALRREGIGEH